MKILTFLCLILLLLSGCQTLDRGSFGLFERLKNNTAHGYNIIDTKQKGFNPRPPVDLVERFEVRNGECSRHGKTNDCVRNTERSEIEEVTRNIYGNGTEQWFKWSIYFPKDYKTIFPSQTILGQFAHYRTHTPAFWFVENNNDYILTGKFIYFNKTLIEKQNLRGKWHDIKINVYWSSNEDIGFMKVWVNNILKINYRGPTILKNKNIFFKYGIYRSNIHRYKGPKSQILPTQTVFYSDVKRSNKAFETDIKK